MISRLLLIYVANAVWMMFVVAAAATLLSRWMRLSPSANRHTLWVVALVLATLLPVTSLGNGADRDLAVSCDTVGETNTSALIAGQPSLFSLHSLRLMAQHGGPSISGAPFTAGLLSAFYVAF
jgi:hypothetical protein